MTYRDATLLQKKGKMNENIPVYTQSIPVSLEHLCSVKLTYEPVWPSVGWSVCRSLIEKAGRLHYFHGPIEDLFIPLSMLLCFTARQAAVVGVGEWYSLQYFVPSKLKEISTPIDFDVAKNQRGPEVTKVHWVTSFSKINMLWKEIGKVSVINLSVSRTLYE